MLLGRGCGPFRRTGQFGSWDWTSAITKIDFYRDHILPDDTIAEDDYIMDHDDDVVAFLEANRGDARWIAATDGANAADPFGVYVHWPFCAANPP